jgi:hypothetical protein
MWLLVSHDAGGAEVVSAWAARHPEIAFVSVVEGPAARIFARKLPAIPRKMGSELVHQMASAEFVLTGTGWASNLEREAIRMARSHRIRVAAYLDHWVNYAERFTVDGVLELPDEIWAGDEAALDLAHRIFPATEVRLEPNQYWGEIRAELAGIQEELPNDEFRLLYVCEPIADHALKSHGRQDARGYTEFDAMRYFFSRLSQRLPPGQRPRIRIRLHPAESRGKYTSLLADFTSYDVEVSEHSSLPQDCQWAHWVVGCESMALVVGLIAGRRVFSAIPPPGKRCRLPHSGIKEF